MNGNSGSVFDYITGLTKTATDTYSALTAKPPQTTVIQAPAAQQQMNWTPWAIGAGVLVLLVVVLAVFGGRRG